MTISAFKPRSVLLQRHHGAAGSNLPQLLAQPATSSFSPSLLLQASYKLSKSDLPCADTTHASHSWAFVHTDLSARNALLPDSRCRNILPTFLNQPQFPPNPAGEYVQHSWVWYQSVSSEPQWHLVSLLYQSVCFSDPLHTAAYSWVTRTNSSLCRHVFYPSTEESTLHMTDTQQILAEFGRCYEMLSMRSSLRKRKSQKLHVMLHLHEYFEAFLLF